MKNWIFAICFMLTAYAHAAPEIDFSRAYVIPEKSSIDTVSIGGVKPLWSDYFFSVDFVMDNNYNLNLIDALAQVSIREQLEQQLRNTTWKGEYAVNNDTFTTTLKLVVVQDSYVGGEIIHTEPQANGGGYLHARVTGDILNQYFINRVFVDEDSLTSDTLANLPANTTVRQLIRIKRVRALKFINDDDGSSWSTNREYRMILENGTLSGSVGIPNDAYGSGDETNENGNILLVLDK